MNRNIDLYLMRHAQSAANIDRALNRTLPDNMIELSPTGFQQAEIAGRALTDHLRSLAIRDVILWVSSYTRAKQTAAAVALNLSDAGISVLHYEDPTLVEQQYGLFDGYHDDDLPREFPREWADYNKWVEQKGRFYARMPNGESRFDVYLRATMFMDRLHRKAEVSNTKVNIVVSHGVTLRMLKMRWLQLTDHQGDQLRNPDNASINLIRAMRDEGMVFAGFPGEHRIIGDIADRGASETLASA